MEESSPTTIIEQLKSFLVYYLNFSLLLCKKHKVALFRNSLNKHIKEHLDDLRIPSSFYKEIISFFNKYNISSPEDIYKRLQSIKKVKPFPELAIINNAFLCTSYRSISLSKRKIQIHCQENHSSNFNLLIKENIRIQGLLPSRFFFEIELDEDYPNPEDKSSESNSDIDNIDINDDTFELAKDDFPH